MKVSAVVVSHGHADELARSLPALLPQVDETVVVANLPGSAAGVPDGVRVLENPRPLSLAANVNLGIAATSGEYVLNVNPDAIAEPGAVAALVAFADAHPRCGIAGPQMRWPDGSWQPSRRRFPTVRGTIVRRTPLRRLRAPYETQREHYALDERPTEPVEADWMLGAFLLMRRAMLDEIGGWDAGFRHYCEDIDLCYRAAQAGWERWYVPDAVVTHAYAAVIDQRFLSRHTLWHARGHGPLRPQASGAPARAVTAKEDQYARQAADWTERAYADVGAYLDHRAELIVALGPRLEPGDEVLDLACGDGGLGEALLARGVRYRGVDSTPEMVAAARLRLGARAEVVAGDLNDYTPPAIGSRRRPCSARSTTRAIAPPSSRTLAEYTEKKLVFDLNPRQYRVEDVLDDLRAAGFGRVELRPFFVPQTVSLPGPVLALAKALERSGPLARAALRARFTYLVAASR